MRIVIDTSVIIAAALSAASPCRQLLEQFVLDEDQLVLVVDTRILDEYRAGLSRAKFKLAPPLVDDLIAAVEAIAVFVDDVAAIHDTTTPQDDRPFLEVSVTGGASLLVTNNARHFGDAAAFGVDVISPDGLLRLLNDE